MNTKSVLVLIFAFAMFFMACSVEEKPNMSRPAFFIDTHIHCRPTGEWEKSNVEVFTAQKATGCVLVRIEDIKRGIQFAKHPYLIIPYEHTMAWIHGLKIVHGIPVN